MKNSLLCLGALAISLISASCNRQPSPERRTSAITPFDMALMTGDVVPVADGGAYLVGIDGIYYIHAGGITPVNGLPETERMLLPEVYPMADGSAILRLTMGSSPSLYSLGKAVARPIALSQVAVTDITEADVTIDGNFYFTEAQRLRAELKDRDMVRNDSDEY